MTVPVSNITATLSNANTIYNVMGFNVSNIAANSQSSLLRFNVNGNTKFRIDLDGNFTDQKEVIWIPAKAMIPSLTSGASVGFTESPTSKIIQNYMSFSDSTVQSAQFDVFMPKTWNKSNVVYKVICSPLLNVASSTSNTVWNLQAAAISSLDSLDPVLTNYSKQVIMGNSNNIIYVSDGGTLTINGNPQDNDLVVFKIIRQTDDALDNLATRSRLLGIQIILNSD